MRTLSKAVAVAAFALAVVGCNSSSNITKNGELKTAGAAAVWTGVAKKDGKATVRVSSSDFTPDVELAEKTGPGDFDWTGINISPDSSSTAREVVFKNLDVDGGTQYAVIIAADESNKTGKYKLVVSDIFKDVTYSEKLSSSSVSLRR